MKSISLDKDHELWVLLRQARDAVHKIRDKELKEYGISSMQASILFICQAIGRDATAAEISRWIFRRPHAVSMLLGRMEKKGLIRRTQDQRRKNTMRIEVTKKGYQALSESANECSSIHMVLSSLSEEEKAQFKSYLLRIRDIACEGLRVNVKPRYP
jgi:DNA-binding MarR family transcriptional regulator